jgi:lipoate-protein ligase A
MGAPRLLLGRTYDLDRIRSLGLDVVRRPTGGRAILHDREITYSVTAPVADAGDLGESYRRINALLLAALESLGVHAMAAAPTARASSPGLTPCFDEPASGELTIGGRKLAGSAQWRAEGALLQHGSILIEDDQSILTTLTHGATSAIPAPATLAESLGRLPSVEEMAGALASAVRAIEDPEARPLDLDETLRARASALVVRYLDDAWTWRR